jgi:hypothetical protein
MTILPAGHLKQAFSMLQIRNVKTRLSEEAAELSVKCNFLKCKGNSDLHIL